MTQKFQRDAGTAGAPPGSLRYLKYLRKEVRETDGRKFPRSWPWLGMIANEARDKLKPIATDNGIPYRHRVSIEIAIVVRTIGSDNWKSFQG